MSDLLSALVPPVPGVPGAAAAATAATGAFPGGAGRIVTEVAFPFRITPHGRVASPAWPLHVEEMIEQVLFTAPGERVNRPDFGCGVAQLVFAAESDALVTATQFLVQGSLQRWLGEVITVNAVVEAVDTTFTVTVQYTLRAGGAHKSVTFHHGGPS
jgi:phage baseplate assembly protein W